MTSVPAGGGNRLELRGEPLERGRRAAVEDRDPLEQRRGARAAATRVDRLQLPPGQRGEHREERPGDDQRPANADDVDQHGGEHGPEADRRDEDRLEHAEDPADHVRRRGALEEREARDVDERVPEAEHGEGDERDPQVRPDARSRRVGRPRSTTEPEVGGEALAADQRESGQRAEHAADARRRVQQADGGVGAMQELEGGDHDQDAERPRQERLRRVQARRRRGAARRGRSPRSPLPPRAGTLARCRPAPRRCRAPGA